MKTVFISFFKIFLVMLMLIKPIVACTYMIKYSNPSIVLELTESEEDSSEETFLESGDEIFHTVSFEWIGIKECDEALKSTHLVIDLEQHIREIVSPPPQV